MADQVKFLKGTQANLTTLQQQVANEQATYVQGAFYLTTDTDRLYYAQTTTNLAHLNQYIRTVAEVSDLEHLPNTVAIGDYYYAQRENILAVKDSEGWTQLNPDTNNRINTTTSGIYAETSNGNVTINLDISDDATTNPRTATGTVSIQGGTNVTVSQRDNVITIDAENDENTTYTIGTDSTSGLSSGQSGAKIVLDSTAANGDSDITLKSANNNLSIGQNNGVITLTAADQSVQNVDAGFDSNGQFQVSVQDKTGSAVSSTPITPTISYGDTTGNNSASTATFTTNGIASLNVYTKAQVDAKIEQELGDFDAMEYLGTVSRSTASTLLTSTENWGSVYKASEAITSTNAPNLIGNANAGDLIIAQRATGYSGNEGGNNSTEWRVIVSQDSQVITYDFDTTDGLVQVLDQNSGAGRTITGATGGKIIVNHTKDPNSQIMATTISQDDSYTAQSISGSDNVTQTAKNDATFTAVTGLTTDSYGNVTSATSKTFTVVDTHANVKTVDTGVATISGGASVTVNVEDTDLVNKADSFNVKSGSLKISQGTTTSDLSIELEWGSF